MLSLHAIAALNERKIVFIVRLCSSMRKACSAHCASHFFLIPLDGLVSIYLRFSLFRLSPVLVGSYQSFLSFRIPSRADSFFSPRSSPSLLVLLITFPLCGSKWPYLKRIFLSQRQKKTSAQKPNNCERQPEQISQRTAEATEKSKEWKLFPLYRWHG